MKDKYDVFKQGETVYVRPMLVDEPMKQNTYIEFQKKEEKKVTEMAI